MEQFLPSAEVPAVSESSTVSELPTVSELHEPTNTIAQLEMLLPEIDIATGLQYCSGDLTLYVDILKILQASAPEQMGNLETAWTAKNYHDYILQVHSLKSQLLNIGHNQLADTAKSLEMAGKENRYEYILQNHESFVASYQDLLKKLEYTTSVLK